ncbi:hypothetical protein HCN44_010866 [Aphidius gifuensis]|uniref:Uncharacterized protein n=1 Tax=Aphidius gifuensis TaxID=684658 RepID=A0A835CMK6_APHGI|nr:hypothetical protein HCN44_010866 [Aphidius gifuensis]
MTKTSKEIRPCDPQYHQRGVTYEPLVNFIQAQLYRGCFADPLTFDCDKTTNMNTQFVNPDDKERKVQYFVVDKGLRVMGIGPSKHVKEFGNSTNIKNLEKKTTEYYCIPTICYVDDKDNEYTVRKFSLNTAKASDGYVLTSVKLSLKNRIFYIDINIQEGKLLQGVLVDPDSLRWKNTIELNDNVITLDRNHSSVNIDDKRNNKLLTVAISHKLKSRATRELSKEIKYALKELNKFQKKKSSKLYQEEGKDLE